MTHVGETTFLFSDIFFLQVLMVLVTLEDRRSQDLSPSYFYQPDTKKPNKILDKSGKFFCLPVQHSVLLLDLRYLTSAQFMFSQLSI